MLIKKYKYILLLFVLGCLPLFPMANQGMFVAHDSQDHVARIANFYQNITEGNIVPRWAGNLNWGYGHPILMFLYPLPSYVASLFIFLGFPLVDAVKLVFAIGFVGSGVAMYWWIRQLYGERAGFVAGILYMFAPYRFVDLYVRGAIGENFFFIFPPLVLYFITKLTRPAPDYDKKNASVHFIIQCIGGALGIAGMVLSHNALTLMFLPFIGAYALLRGRRSLMSLMAVIVLGFGFSAFFWMPAFFEGKYTLRDIVTKNEVFSRFESFPRLLYSPWSFGGTGQFSVQIGIAQWGLIIVGLVFLFWAVKNIKYQRSKIKETNQTLTIPQFDFKFLLLLFVTFWTAIFMMLPVSKPLYEMLTILQKFQFPWRFLSLAIFPPAVIGGLLAAYIPKKYRIFLVILISTISVGATIPFWNPKSFEVKPESYYFGIYEGTTDTGESAPIWSVRFMLEKPSAFAEVVEGEGELTLVERSTTRHVYRLHAVSETVRVLENTLYFPGWFVTVDGVRLPVSSILFQDPAYRGLMTFYVHEKGDHTILVEFTETKLRALSNTISLTSGILIMGLFVLIRRRI